MFEQKPLLNSILEIKWDRIKVVALIDGNVRQVYRSVLSYEVKYWLILEGLTSLLVGVIFFHVRMQEGEKEKLIRI